MKFIAIPFLLASIASAIPAPQSNPAIPESWKRSMENNLKVVRASNAALTDEDILNFALTLEHLEDKFYREGLNMFTAAEFQEAGYTPRTRFNIREVSADETTHVATIKSVLGKDAVPACEYDFGLTDAKSFVALAGVLEGVGITAYLGAAALIKDPTYLTVAGSILTVESRHSAYLRDNQLPTQSPFAQPFDVPLSARAVFTLASGVIKKCPKSADLGITPFPTLSLKPGQSAEFKAGDVAIFDIQKGTTVTKGSTYGAFATVFGPVFAPIKSKANGTRVEITVPKGVAGQSYAFLTNSATSAADKHVVAGPGIIMITPAYAVDGFPTGGD